MGCASSKDAPVDDFATGEERSSKHAQEMEKKKRKERARKRAYTAGAVAACAGGCG